MTVGIRSSALAVLLALAVFGLPASASAASATVNCEQLQKALEQAKAGDTVTLTQMCTKSNSGEAEGRFKLPENAAFTLTGTPGAGFDGTGVGEAVLQGAGVEGFTLSSLTVQNASTTQGAVTLVAGAGGGVTVRSVTFTNNHSTGSFYSAGALLIHDLGCLAPGTIEAPLTISESTFSGNSNASTSESDATGGGATVWAGAFSCTAIRPVSVVNNSFSANTAASRGAGVTVRGGGLAVLSNGEAIDPLTQSGNTFTGNAVAGFEGATTADFGGGGEWVEGLDLTSTGDSFIANTATGSTTPTVGWTWGAGLGIVNSNCTESMHTQGLATNLAVAGNSITGGLPADVQGAGIYTGCDPGSGSDLTLKDSTVSGNATIAGAVAGIYGESADRLTLSNTIDAGNIAGSDLGGFSGVGGAITASYSDACLSGAALSGAGNLCAPPLLVSASDVHETASSPTIDKGSNALVPAGLTADFFGSGRVLAGRAVCSPPAPAAIVDIGAAEFVAPIPPCPPVVTPTPNSSFSLTNNPKVNASTGAITFTVSVHDPGTFSWVLTFANGKFGVYAANARKRCARTQVRLKGRCRPSRVLFGKGSKSVVAPGLVSFTVKPSAAARKALKSALAHHRGLPVTALLSFQSARGGAPVSHTETISIRLKKPRKGGK